jgi:hypothetical protein
LKPARIARQFERVKLKPHFMSSQQPKLVHLSSADRVKQDLIFEFIEHGDYSFDPSEYETYCDRFVAAQELLLIHFPQTRWEILDVAVTYLLSRSN